jgi:NhaP-type Na+/H+ or K+/H+ antiporter
MSLAEWSLLLGSLLVMMVLTGTLLGRLPLSSAMVYLVLGWVLGPNLLNFFQPDPIRHTLLLQQLAEVALLISLFAVGMKLGVPMRDARWRLPLRLAFGAMAAMVALIAVVGVFALGLSVGAAVLLGAILAPTDPVLASGVKSDSGPAPDRLGFSLAGEGALNDGAAFPFVMLGLGLLGLHELGPGMIRWWTIDLFSATVAGTAIGAAVGAMTGRLVVYLRSRHGEAKGLDEFLCPGLVGMAYGLAQISLVSGFLAVFAAGMAFQRVRDRPGRVDPTSEASEKMHAREMRDSVQTFNEQLEKLAEMALVLTVGAMLAYCKPMPAAWWFVPVVLVLMRPISVIVALPGERLTPPQQAMIGWFGIRGIGSVFYLLFSLRQGIDPALADMLISLTLWTVAGSIVVHGITAQPLMRRYLKWRQREGDG